VMIEAICSTESSVLTRPHAVTFQKTTIFIVITVNPSNITSLTLH
jgi:hypothetical protein